MKKALALASVAQLVGALSHTLRGREFDALSGHVPRFQIWSLLGCVGEATD